MPKNNTMSGVQGHDFTFYGYSTVTLRMPTTFARFGSRFLLTLTPRHVTISYDLERPIV